MLAGKTVVCVGGTFNRLHAGHRVLFKTAFESAEQVAIGLASDALVRRLRKERAKDVRPYPEREADLRRLLSGFPAERFSLQSLDDPYMPAKREEFDAIVVSPETRKTAEEINALRALRGFADIRIIEAPHVLAYDGQPISSTRILNGEIDEEGRRVGAPAARTKAEPKPAAAPVDAPAPARTAEQVAAKYARPKAPPKKAPRRAAKKPRAIGKRASKKRAPARSKARKGSRATGPRSRR